MKDVKDYMQTIAKRLGSAFSMESFEMEDELEFWVLAAEYLSRKEIPSFRDIVNWLDILYKAPVHFVYVRQEEQKLNLYHRTVVTENLENKFSLKNLSAADRKEKVSQFEQRLDNLENTITVTEEMKESGSLSFPIGSCYHIPLFKNETFWGIYCIGPYADNPSEIVPRISIMGRILSKWLIKEYEKDRKKDTKVKSRVADQLGELHSGSLNIGGYAKVLLRHLINVRGAKLAFMVEFEHSPQLIAKANIDEEKLKVMQDYSGPADDSEQLKAFIQDHFADANEQGDYQILVERLDSPHSCCYLVIKVDSESSKSFESAQSYNTIIQTLENLLTYRSQNLTITNDIVEVYYQMLREVEQKREQSRYHTDRVVALSLAFADYFGMDEKEKENVRLTAKLHDVGYLSVRSGSGRPSVGDDLDHPLLGYHLIEDLSIDQEIKEGVKTHQEWVDGSGTPRGVESGEIAWTGKVVGLFEFITEFIETHRNDTSKTEEEWMDQLTDALIERADIQFDMVLIPATVEMLDSLEWSNLCKMGEG